MLIILLRVVESNMDKLHSLHVLGFHMSWKGIHPKLILWENDRKPPFRPFGKVVKLTIPTGCCAHTYCFQLGYIMQHCPYSLVLQFIVLNKGSQEVKLSIFAKHVVDASSKMYIPTLMCSGRFSPYSFSQYLVYQKGVYHIIYQQLSVSITK